MTWTRQFFNAACLSSRCYVRHLSRPFPVLLSEVCCWMHALIRFFHPCLHSTLQLVNVSTYPLKSYIYLHLHFNSPCFSIFLSVCVVSPLPDAEKYQCLGELQYRPRTDLKKREENPFIFLHSGPPNSNIRPSGPVGDFARAQHAGLVFQQKSAG